MICEPTFNVNDKLFGLDLKTLFGAGPNFADPGPSIPQVQVGHTDGAVKVWIFSKPLDTASLNVDAFTNNVSIKVGCLPTTKMNFPVGDVRKVV